MTEYLTSSITPTLGNENKLILQGEKENLWELWKSITFVRSVQEFLRIQNSLFFFFLFFSKHEQGICTELEWKLLSLVFQDKEL